MKPLSYQLYSSRNFQPLGDTLAMLGRLGYTQVEGFAGLFSDTTDMGALRAVLDANGLHMTSCHFGLDAVRDTPEIVIERARALNIQAVFVPAVPPEQRQQDAAGWEQLGKTLADIGKPLQDAGLTFGWHNHAFEFASIDGDVLPLELILAGDDSLALEFDVAWCIVGKQDPATWIERYRERLVSVHVKDIAAPGECMDEDGWADVGHGTMDWAGILGKLDGAPVRFFVMEHDNPSDHERFALRSIESLRSLMQGDA
ncbi:MAG: sugar phosphate isomerase/epimerase family protein [Granulosicoccus sp.]